MGMPTEESLVASSVLTKYVEYSLFMPTGGGGCGGAVVFFHPCPPLFVIRKGEGAKP